MRRQPHRVVNPAKSFAVEDPEQALRQAVAAEIRENRFPIPPLPQVAVELNKIASAPEPDLRAATALVERDPQLAGRVLDLASSAAMGARAKITELRRAVLRVGASGLRDLAFAVMMGQFVKGELAQRVRGELQRAFVVACGTQHLCRELRLDRHHGFLCGLLADVGRLAMLAPLTTLSREGAVALDAASIDATIDLMHADVSALVIARWGLEDVVREVARSHHRPGQAGPHQPLALAVAVADAAAAIEAETPQQRASELSLSPWPRQQALDEDQLLDLAQTVDLALLDASAFFGG